MYKNILLPVDLNESQLSQQAILAANRMAEITGARLHLLNVVPGVSMPMLSNHFPEHLLDDIRDESAENLRRFARQHLSEDADKCRFSVREGRPARQILEYAADHQIDLIVMPSHKRSNLDKLMVGSVTRKVLDNSKISVFVIK